MALKPHTFIQKVLESPPEWLTYSGMIKSCQCRFLRNLAGFNFPQKQDAESHAQVLNSVHTAATALWGEGIVFIRLEELSKLELGLLIESEILPDNAELEPAGKGLLIANDYKWWAVLNHENHLGITAALAGLALPDAFATINRIDDDLSERMDFAFDQRLGFLTSSPANVGTGFNATIDIELPALIILKQIHRVFNGIGTLGLAIVNKTGKPLPIASSNLKISNQTSLGVAEDDLLDRMGTVAEALEYHEGSAREALRKEAQIQLADKVDRARGILLSARLLGTHEAQSMLAALRLGVEMGLSDFPDLGTIQSLMLRVQPARLQLEYGAELGHTDREAYRADLVHNSLTH
jgi:protein arginine kinase